MLQPTKLFWLLLASMAPFSQTVAATPIEELNSLVAIVDEDVITRLELDRRIIKIKQQLAQRNTPLPSEAALERQVLERMIVEHLQLTQAKKRGVTVDDESLNKVLNNIAAENGLSLIQLREVLQEDGIDFTGFREQIRDEIIISRLRNSVVESRINITEQEIDSFLESQQEDQNRNTEYRVAHILIALPEAASPEQVQEARARAEKVLQELESGADFSQLAATWSDGQQALKGGDLDWRKASELPTLFSEVVLTMQPGTLSELIRSPSGFHILKLTEIRGQQQQSVITQTHARHILIQTSSVVSDQEARQKLERLRERLLNGDDFAELARIHSEDSGSGANGGDLGWANPDSYVPAFEEAMNNLTTGELSEPFKSRFGWHILQVIERRDQDNSASINRDKARKILRNRKKEEETKMWLRRIRDEAYVEYRLNS